MRIPIEEFFVSALIYDDIISAYRPGLKTGMHRMDFRGLVWKRV